MNPTAWATRTVGGRKFHSIHASKEASDKWIEFKQKEHSRGEEYEQIALYDVSLKEEMLRIAIEVALAFIKEKMYFSAELALIDALALDKD